MNRKTLRVGPVSGDLTGNTNFVIQAAIDYLSYIGGGTVKLDEGVYNIDSAIHMRSNVTLEGTPGKTVLRKGREIQSPLLADADLHERKVVVKDPDLFEPGQTIIIKFPDRPNGFNDTVAVITAKDGNILYLDREMYYTKLLKDNPVAATNFPVISAYDCSNVTIRDIIIDGNKEENSYADGCRNGGIYFFGCSDMTIENCTVRNYNGDGISYQNCRNIMVINCECSDNEGLGFHPGSGTSFTVLSGCKALRNKKDGFFFCWRVTDSIVENCIAAENHMSGLSIGHKDTHNIIRNSEFSNNVYYGLFFRNEPDPMGANFNVVENCIIKNNGRPGTAYGFAGIRMRGSTNNVRLINNKIIYENFYEDAKPIGVVMESEVHDIYMAGNEFKGCARETHDKWIIED